MNNIEQYLTELKENIARQIKKTREDKNWTQVELARKCHLNDSSRTTINKWEKGISTPSFGQLEDLCKAFGCEMTYLFGDELKTRDDQFIKDKTGLNQAAISKLSVLCTVAPEVMAIINDLLVNPYFFVALNEFSKAEETAKQISTRDHFEKIIRSITDEKELLHNFRASADSQIVEDITGIPLEVSADMLSRLYYLSAKDHFIEAISDLFKTRTTPTK